jgi:hypothetical protein
LDEYTGEKCDMFSACRGQQIDSNSSGAYFHVRNMLLTENKFMYCAVHSSSDMLSRRPYSSTLDNVCNIDNLIEEV